MFSVSNSFSLEYVRHITFPDCHTLPFLLPSFFPFFTRSMLFPWNSPFVLFSFPYNSSSLFLFLPSFFTSLPSSFFPSIFPSFLPCFLALSLLSSFLAFFFISSLPGLLASFLPSVLAPFFLAVSLLSSFLTLFLLTLFLLSYHSSLLSSHLLSVAIPPFN